MGWGNCGTDSKDRPIGYLFEATCDFSGCDKRIDRGLDFACGSMHGFSEYGCEGYFCHNHLYYSVYSPVQLCPQCHADLENNCRGVLCPECGVTPLKDNEDFCEECENSATY